MKIFVTGASGYVGGTVLAALLRDGHKIRGLVRSEQRADQVRALGVEPVRGTLADLPLLQQEAGQADAVINAADADERASVEAMLSALAGTSKPFIHTSGSSIVADCAAGAASQKIYEDDTPVQPLPARAARVALNAVVMGAAHSGIRSIVIAPTMIYGKGLGVNPNSIQVPKMIAVARLAGTARIVGSGLNAWSNVHVEDLADFYLLALHKAKAGSFFYAENGENALYDIAASIHRMMGVDRAPQSMTMPEAEEAYGSVPANYSFGSNSRVRAVRARRELGWAPHRRSLLDEIEHGAYAGAA